MPVEIDENTIFFPPGYYEAMYGIKSPQWSDGTMPIAPDRVPVIVPQLYKQGWFRKGGKYDPAPEWDPHRNPAIRVVEYPPNLRHINENAKRAEMGPYDTKSEQPSKNHQGYGATQVGYASSDVLSLNMDASLNKNRSVWAVPSAVPPPKVNHAIRQAPQASKAYVTNPFNNGAAYGPCHPRGITCIRH